MPLIEIPGIRTPSCRWRSRTLRWGDPAQHVAVEVADLDHDLAAVAVAVEAQLAAELVHAGGGAGGGLDLGLDLGRRPGFLERRAELPGEVVSACSGARAAGRAGAPSFPRLRRSGYRHSSADSVPPGIGLRPWIVHRRKGCRRSGLPPVIGRQPRNLMRVRGRGRRTAPRPRRGPGRRRRGRARRAPRHRRHRSRRRRSTRRRPIRGSRGGGRARRALVARARARMPAASSAGSSASNASNSSIRSSASSIVGSSAAQAAVQRRVLGARGAPAPRRRTARPRRRQVRGRRARSMPRRSARRRAARANSSLRAAAAGAGGLVGVDRGRARRGLRVAALARAALRPAPDGRRPLPGWASTTAR